MSSSSTFVDPTSFNPKDEINKITNNFLELQRNLSLFFFRLDREEKRREEK